MPGAFCRPSLSSRKLKSIRSSQPEAVRYQNCLSAQIFRCHYLFRCRKKEFEGAPGMRELRVIESAFAYQTGQSALYLNRRTPPDRSRIHVEHFVSSFRFFYCNQQ